MECSVHLCQHPHSSLIFNFSNYTTISLLIKLQLLPYLPLLHLPCIYQQTSSNRSSLPATSGPSSSTAALFLPAATSGYGMECSDFMKDTKCYLKIKGNCWRS
ncbi:hypothetical protein Hanom_Chr08g00721041 [Helianthus anomalus]